MLTPTNLTLDVCQQVPHTTRWPPSTVPAPLLWAPASSRALTLWHTLTSMPGSQSSLGSHLTEEQHFGRFTSLSLCIVIAHCHHALLPHTVSSQSPCTVTMHCHRALSLSTVTAHCHLTISPYTVTALSPHTVTTHCHCFCFNF